MSGRQAAHLLLLLATCAPLSFRLQTEAAGARAHARPPSDLQGCRRVSTCACQTEDGGVVDLTPLANNNLTPRYFDVADNSGIYVYSWNPCNDFDEGECQNVALCQKDLSQSSPLYYTLGWQNTADFVISSSYRLMIQYTGPGGYYLANRTSYVQLQCDQTVEGAITAEGEIAKLSGIYYFTLRSRYACLRGGPSSTVTPITFPPPVTSVTQGPDHSLKTIIELLFCLLLTAGTGVVVLLMVLAVLLVRKSRAARSGSRDKVSSEPGLCALLVNTDGGLESGDPIRDDAPLLKV